MPQYMIALFIIFGPVIGYIFQYFEIEKSPKGFSLPISYILLASNLLRILFWHYKRFEDILMYQSIVMILVQLILLRLVCRVRQYSFKRHIQVLSIFALSLYTLRNIKYSFLTELVGTLALLIESGLGIPQFFQNMKVKSTEGLDLRLVLTWMIGDLVKTALFIYRSSPFQFIACGIVQMSVDILILWQFIRYRK